MSATAVEPLRTEPQPFVGHRFLVLLNAKAGSAGTGAEAALNRLRQAGFEITEPPGDQGGRLAEVIRQHASRVDAVVVGGGDGTLRSAADGLVGTDLPLGILPLGTANDLARTLALPTDPVRAAGVIAGRQLRPIDVGWVNGLHFFNVASIGLTEGVTRRLSRQGKGRWGVYSYLLAASQVVVRARPFGAEIVGPDGTHRVKTVQIAVGNGRHYGGGMTVDADAQIDDGLLHLYSLEVQNWWRIVPLLPALRRGTLAASPVVRTLQGNEFEVRPLRGVKRVYADGEVVARTPATFRVLRGAVSVFAPPEPAKT